jgi:phosphoribosylaminoimidazolecarboxamide formyltransferase/IMP cyclohydrolase
MSQVRRALISVTDKTGIVEFARALSDLGVRLVSTGGTARLLAEHNVALTQVSDYTGFPEVMDGRLKTLHPRIHGGLLARRRLDEAVMAEHGIDPIDLLVVNLYRFEETVADPSCNLATAVENIDIGGPAMLRAAAKNHAAVVVVVDVADYQPVLAELRANGGWVGDRMRRDLAAKAFARTAAYDGAIANFLSSLDDTGGRQAFPVYFHLSLRKAQGMRYGENPHQRAAFYLQSAPQPGSVATATQLQGKELSYNNLVDSDAALECVKCFDQPACVIVKHANPCGVAVATDAYTAYQRAYQSDLVSAFGGIIAFNRALDRHTAAGIVEQQFVEVIIAPEVTDDAVQALATKQNIRVLAAGAWQRDLSHLDFKSVTGGVLFQERDAGSLNADAARSSAEQPQVVTQRAPTDAEWDDLLFAWQVAKFVKSNAIVLCNGGVTVGIGAGQTSRVDAVKLAASKAADGQADWPGVVMASDAFFPFRDGIDRAAEAGVAAVIQPGGSVRDAEVIAAADQHGMAMVFTGMRHFRH